MIGAQKYRTAVMEIRARMIEKQKRRLMKSLYSGLRFAEEIWIRNDRRSVMAVTFWGYRRQEGDFMKAGSRLPCHSGFAKAGDPAF
jgi:hypothetical protein